MLRLGALEEDVSRYCRCLQHGLNNAFSNAIIESVGNQGLGHDTCLQMVFGLIKMLRTVIKDRGMSVYDEYYKIVMKKLKDDDVFFSECMDKFEPEAQGLLDEMMSEDLDEVADLYEKGMRGTMLSVLTRWQTAIPGIKLVVEKYPILYTFAVTLIADEKSGTTLHSIASDAVKLMNIYPEDSKTPVLLTQLKFILAFTDAFHAEAFSLACQADERFGADSFGHTCQLQVERTYVWKMMILDIKRNIRTHPKFKKYNDALNSLSDAGEVEDFGKAFFLKIEEVFFAKYIQMYEKHVEEVFLHPKVSVCLIGGSPEVLYAWAKWIHHAHENQGAVTVDANGNELASPPYAWESKEVKLYGHRSDKNKSVKVKLDEMMRYLTRNYTALEVLDDDIVKSCLQSLLEIAELDEAVDIYEDEDFVGLMNVVHRRIAPMTTQNQGVENHVQATALVRYTGVGDARASLRMPAYDWFVRALNTYSKERKMRRLIAQGRAEDAKKVVRTKDWDRNRDMLDWSDQAMVVLKRYTEDGSLEAMIEDLTAAQIEKNKTFNKECAQHVVDFGAASERRQTPSAAEMPSKKAYISPTVGNVLVITKLRARQHRDALIDEIVLRYSTRSKKSDRKSEEELSALNWRDLVRLLKEHERTELVLADSTKNIEWRDVRTIDPRSDSLKTVLSEMHSLAGSASV
mmetsp:Transcript_25816/g.58927  ORF Transcript_25816/g.58927 Transcript_25816/m.58927 type:complete len:686 (-) Transcript_25816:368-2425(-)